MIEPNLPGLSVRKQCALLSISRSSLYYEPKGETEMNLDLMRVIDKQFLETPFYGVRQMTWHLRNEDHLVNEKRIRRLMRLMGVRRGIDPPDQILILLTPDLPETQHQQGGQGAQDLPLSAARATRGSTQPCLVRRYHLSADASRLSVSGRHHGLAHAQNSGMADIEHTGGGLLRRGIERSDP